MVKFVEIRETSQRRSMGYRDRERWIWSALGIHRVPYEFWKVGTWKPAVNARSTDSRIFVLFSPPSHHFFFSSSSAYKNQQPSEIFTSIFFFFYYSSLLLQLYSSSTRPSYCHNEFNIPIKKKRKKKKMKLNKKHRKIKLKKKKEKVKKVENKR